MKAPLTPSGLDLAPSATRRGYEASGCLSAIRPRAAILALRGPPHGPPWAVCRKSSGTSQTTGAADSLAGCGSTGVQPASTRQNRTTVMPSPQHLHCQHGDHDWTREPRRGRPPKHCPDHPQPVTNDLGTDPCYLIEPPPKGASGVDVLLWALAEQSAAERLREEARRRTEERRRPRPRGYERPTRDILASRQAVNINAWTVGVEAIEADTWDPGRGMFTRALVPEGRRDNYPRHRHEGHRRGQKRPDLCAQCFLDAAGE